MTLEDFVNLPTKAISWAQDPPCSGLRLYTFSSFWNFNAPLRQSVTPHPWKFIV